MTTQVFIDGEAGTTGLQIFDRLKDRSDISLIQLGEDRRKDLDARRDALNAADVAILCLPDAAAIDSVEMIENDTTRVIDASTAHRVADGWVYGFPELTKGHAEAVANARFVANVGCYATGSISLIRPLVEAGLLAADAGLTIHGVSGYTGGGKALIAEMEAAGSSDFFLYGLDQGHKHLPEITKYGLLSRPPIFVPAVAKYAQGMALTLSLPKGMVDGDREALLAVYQAHYAHGGDVIVVSDTEARLDPQMHNDTNTMSIHVRGNAETGQMVAVAVLDNLGKGASGSAVQNLDLMICA
ncbi:N-acetyl-gamma-glutamyl-phosphate reductase [Rubricella aquisinus]|uniref:N-acetyl-gamma-glutamyl-phosphate reductase n=1 Tax=Rubricella aquisinus TaxID=2028108 RepID=A0A840WRN6_9RHOB|nr:N-acetyl-gamma-glutamyl-phosphate reductase [Rubricella aquisinus]MBB5516332.1 N-acetyl-gamma-glutamyl-phosphate reductase [Rubricella aquisinus]